MSADFEAGKCTDKILKKKDWGEDGAVVCC